MSTKCLVALALLVALVAFASADYLDDVFEDLEGGGEGQELEGAAMQYLLQKRGRGARYSRCVDPETGHVCKCAKSRARSLFYGNSCQK